MSFSIRLAQVSDLLTLPEIEVEARSRFTDIEMSTELRAYQTPAHELRMCQSEDLLWIAEIPSDGVIGFLAAETFEQSLHVLQLSVRTSAGRRGVGTCLLSRAHQEAKARGLPHLSLTTFANVPWNAPAYAKQGFVALDPYELTPGLRRRLANESAAGLSNRVAMRRLVT